MSWINIQDCISFLADVFILLITLYTFYITFISQKIKLVSTKISEDLNVANRISVILENKTLSPQIIDNVSMIIDNNYKIVIRSFDIPLVLEPYKTCKVVSELFSYTEPQIDFINILKNDIIIEVSTTRNKIYLQSDNRKPKIKEKMKSIPYNVTKIINKYDGKFIPKNAKYALRVSNNNWSKTIFILEDGDFTDEILGCNKIESEKLQSVKQLREILDEWLNPFEFKYYIKKLKG